MKKRIARCYFTCDGKKEIMEELELDPEQNLESQYKKILKEYNATLYPHELPRHFVRAEWKDEKIVEYCEYRKVNNVTLFDSRGPYDLWRCIHCGHEVKRRGLSPPPKRKCKGKGDDAK